MTNTDCTLWGSAERPGALPASILRLEGDLRTAIHAFDDAFDELPAGTDAHGTELAGDHRARIVDDVTGVVLDAASAAARAGHGDLATLAVWNAAERRPAWAALSPAWDALIAASHAAIAAVAVGEAAAEPPTIGA
jgi:hypothetical protein